MTAPLPPAPSGPLASDPLVWPILTGLQTCLDYWLRQAGRPACYITRVFNGGPPPADCCDCTGPNNAQGHGWVRMVTLNAASGASRMGDCANGIFDLTCELGVYRCSPTPDDGEASVPKDVEEAHAAGMYCDAAAIRRAVRCCNPLDQAHLAPTIVTESARGPSGGCVGVELQTSMTVMDCGCGDGS